MSGKSKKKKRARVGMPTPPPEISNGPSLSWLFTSGADTTTPSGARLQISQPNTSREEIGVLLNTDRFKYFAVIQSPWNIWSHLVVTIDLENGPSTVIYR